IPKDALAIGIVARLSIEKGHLVFLKAAKKIINDFYHAHFLIVGDGKERKKLEEITQELEIQSNVHFLGIRSDIPQIISLFDVAVLTSNPVVETFSNAILEYMAASKPVVATNVGSTSELVIDGETGFLIPFNDSDTLANAILRLLKDGGLAKKMGEVGREKIKERFTVQKMIAKYESLFADLVK
ncbi:MAG: glycosyltransferase, partial [Nitrosopumilus sp.]